MLPRLNTVPHVNNDSKYAGWPMNNWNEAEKKALKKKLEKEVL
jgi:hypothetical protein